jgi:hypothetical protein
VPYYNKVVNVIWGGLWVAILDVTVILLVTQVTIGSSADPVALKDFMTKVRKQRPLATLPTQAVPAH